MRFTFQSRRSRPEGPGGRIAATLFGLVFGSFGMLFVVLTVRDARERLATLRWEATPCTIATAESREDGDRYRFEATYAYSHGGRDYTGDAFTHGGGARHESVTEGARLAERYAPGTAVTGYVNPANPAQAILRRDASPAKTLLPVLFCCIFPLVGYGMVVMTGAGRRRRDGGGAEARPARTPLLVPILFGLLFLLVGLGLTHSLLVRPLQRQRAARAWQPVEAEVTRSLVRVHRGDDNDTYSVYIAYRYTVDGRRYVGDRYSFAGGSSSGREAKARVVAAHPPGSRLTVYVDPADPHESVILRDAVATLLVGLFPLLFALVGGAVLVWGTRHVRRANAELAATARGGGPRAWRLSRPQGAGARLAGLLFAALFWNGIVSVFAGHVLGEWQRGRRPIGLSVFLVPFVLVGLLLIGLALRELLRLSNPRVLLEPLLEPLTAGVPATLRFRARGDVSRFAKLEIALEGKAAEARTGRGAPHEVVLHRQTLLELDNALLMGEGTCRLTLPAELVREQRPGWRQAWTVTVTGRVPRWPDSVETYRLVPER